MVLEEPLMLQLQLHHRGWKLRVTGRFMTVLKNMVTQEMQNVLHLGGMEATKTKENLPKINDMIVARVNPKLSHMKGVRDESVIMDSKVSSQMIKGTKSHSACIAKMRGQA
jgi:hypothetical protein